MQSVAAGKPPSDRSSGPRTRDDSVIERLAHTLRQHDDQGVEDLDIQGA